MLVIIITIGKQTEQDYQALFNRKCPRPVKIRNLALGEGIFKDCLMVQWQPLLQETISELLIDPPKINQLIKGRTGNRSFNQEKTDELINIIESKVREKIRKTDEGIAFYKEGKNTSVKALTFCILGCQLLLIAQERWNLSKIKAKIINKTIVHYYLEGTKICNSDIQEIEQQIISREKKNQREEKEEQKFELEQPKNQIDFDFTTRIDGDPKLTEILLNHCPKSEKQAITCDVDRETYSLVIVKLIHSFLHKIELFDDIDLTAECLREERFDIQDLRVAVDHYLLEHGKELDWSKEAKGKFLFCSLCHLTRELVALKKLEPIEGIRIFFEHKGEIYGLTSELLLEEKREAFKQFFSEEPRVIGGKTKPKEVVLKQLPKNKKEKMLHFALPKSSRIEDLKQFFEQVAQSIDTYSLLPGEIRDKRIIAKNLLGITEEGTTTSTRDISWINRFSEVWRKEIEYQPFLALVILDEIDGILLTQKQKNQLEITDEEAINFSLLTPEQFNQFEDMKIHCDSCPISMQECQERKKQINKLIVEDLSQLNIYWKSNEKIQPCIAKVIMERKKKGQF